MSRKKVETAKRSRIKNFEGANGYHGNEKHLVIKPDMTPKGSAGKPMQQQKIVPKTVKNLINQPSFKFQQDEKGSQPMSTSNQNPPKLISNQVATQPINETRVTEQLNESSSNEHNDDYKININIKKGLEDSAPRGN